MKRVTRVNLLVFKGLRMSDLDEPEQIILEDAEIPKFYNDIPTTWEGEQLEYNEFLCWNCGLHGSRSSGCAFIPIDPILVPTTDNPYNTRVSYTRLGSYCSWPCAARDAINRFGKVHLPDILESIRAVFNELYNVDVDHVTPAPEKTFMSVYCGNNGISETEYMDSVKKITDDLISGVQFCSQRATKMKW